MSDISSPNKKSSTRRQSTRSPKKSQLQFALGLLLLIIILTLLLNKQKNNTAWFFITGLGFGYVLQRSRFCFAASIRDPFLTGRTSLTRAVLIAFAITTIGFTAIKYGYFSQGLAIPGMSYVVPISLATLAGGFMFGIGMVIAGGCATGTLMRVGEGFTMQVISLIFFIIGSLWGAHDFSWWQYNFISKGKAVFLPDMFGWFGAVILQLFIIFLLYVAAKKYQEAKEN